MQFFKALLIWFVILVVAFANGALRELVLAPRLGHTVAQLCSGALLCMAVGLIALVALPTLGPLTRGRAWAIGGFWLVMTLAFEFGFGSWVQHKPLSELLQAYTFAGGNLWPLVLLMIVCAPRLALKVRSTARNTARRLPDGG